MQKTKYGVFFAVILLTINQLCYSQELEQPQNCAAGKSRLAAKATVDDPAENNYDIKYLKFNISLNNQSIFIRGDVATTAVTTVSSFVNYVFELNSALLIDSVLINGIARPVTTVADVRTVALGGALPENTTFTAHVYYHGTPLISGTIFGSIGGINTVVSPSWGTKVTFTQSESYHAKEWWPCKQSLLDKIDSVDMWITVPDSMRAGSNGTLERVTTIDSLHVRYEWKERYPIDYYLISAAVAPYIDYSYYMHFTGTVDSMLVQNYVYPNPATLLAFKNVIDSTGKMIDYFSTIYGRYPFWKEKYGHCMAPLSGGMEHQTMTTLGYFGSTVVAHELGHQWFGDNATCSTWADISMNEGFAGYTEYLYIDHFWTHAQAINDIKARHDNVTAFDTGSVYVDDTANEARVFDSRLTYDKGACMLHMLRFVIGDDSIFFHIYKTYQEQYKNSNGSIMDFKNAAKSVLGPGTNGISLDTFFSQWAYGQGFPEYTLNWNQVSGSVLIKFDQATSDPSWVPLFTMPVEIKLHSATGDTIVKVINDQSSQYFTFNWSKQVVSMTTDPNLWLLYRLDTVIHNTHLGVKQMAEDVTKVIPNPAKETWQLSALPVNSHMILTDMTGRVLWQGNNGNASTYSVPAANLAPGLYLLRVCNGDMGNATYKLVKD